MLRHLLLFVPLLAGCPLLDTGDTGEPGSLRFGFPVAERDRIGTATVYMDHDPETYEGVWALTCTAFSGDRFPWCYDVVSTAGGGGSP